MNCTTVDKFLFKNKLSVDILDIDCQGHNLDILKGAKKALKKILCIKVELDFLKLYKKSAKAGDIFNFMEQAGFRLLRLYSCGNKRRKYSYDTVKGSRNMADGLVAWMDGVFIKDPNKLKMVTNEQFLKFKKLSSLFGAPSLTKYIKT